MVMPIAPERDDRASLARALDVARLLSCHLDVVYVRPDPEQTFFYTGLTAAEKDDLVADMRHQMEHEGQAAAERTRRIFADLCKSAGIEKLRKPEFREGASCSWRQLRGEPFSLLPGLAMSADIVFFTPQTSKYTLIAENVLEAALLRSGRPIFYGAGTEPPQRLSRVLIAWDGSASCSRAISAWLSSGLPRESAAIVHISDGYEDIPTTASIGTLLEWHGVPFEEHNLSLGIDHAGNLIAEAARTFDCGLIVMGGYGHLRDWEAAFGGVTRYMIRHSPLPVLMMH